MKREYFHFTSAALQRDMAFLAYGHSGKPLLVFPSSGGRFYEYEDFQMIEAIRPLIEEGRLRVYTPDSIDAESWLHPWADPRERVRRHEAYERYVMEELLPFIRFHSGHTGGIMVTGCSMGGYHSANFYFRHPDAFDSLIALSGIYDARFFVGESMHFGEVYFHSPVDYLKNLSDPFYLEHYRRGRIILCTGQGAWEEDSLRDTRAMEAILREKNIPAWVDYWGEDVHHDWPWWRRQMVYFLHRLKEEGRL